MEEMDDATERLSPTKPSGRKVQADLVRRVREGWIATRRDASRMLGIAPSTAGDYIGQLMGADVLRERPDNSGRVGRPQHYLELNREAGYFVGVDFEANTLMAQVVDFACRPIYRERRELEGGRVEAERMLLELESLIEAATGEAPGPVLALGLGIPGLLDQRRGRALDYPLIEGWWEVDLRERFAERFGLPVCVDNTARSGARAEKLFGGARRLTDFACVVNRGGLGVGAYEQGRLLTGFGGAFGELGRAEWPGSAGGVGGGRKLEELASYRALFGEFGVRRGDPDWGALGARIDAGEAAPVAAFERAVAVVGWSLGVTASLLNPEAVFLQSPLTGLGERFRKRLRAEMERVSGLPAEYAPRLEFSGLGHYAGAMGAAALAVESWEPTPSDTAAQQMDGVLAADGL